MAAGVGSDRDLDPKPSAKSWLGCHTSGLSTWDLARGEWGSSECSAGRWCAGQGGSVDKQWLQCLLKALQESLSVSSSGHEGRVGKGGGGVGGGGERWIGGWFDAKAMWRGRDLCVPEALTPLSSVGSQWAHLSI